MPERDLIVYPSKKNLTTIQNVITIVSDSLPETFEVRRQEG